MKDIRSQRPFSVYGREHIEDGAFRQMEVALELPITVSAALMPDAHQGYGLPIGGVLAADNAVIPYGVGVDIGCRMALSVYDLPPGLLHTKKDSFIRAIADNTLFGPGRGFSRSERADHAVLEDPLFKENAWVNALKDKAWEQLGTSGGGNHFVEFGVLTLEEEDPGLGLEKGEYIALLSHSGSRGLGATIANHYTKIAKSKCPLPGEAANLAYLFLDSQEGQEYWAAMQLAGNYASACHETIHTKINRQLGQKPLAKVENHHNFAWKEVHDGKEVIVHRKGATPASENTLGFIPGSMATPGFLVRGKGNTDAIHSAAHGAGRLMSRNQAIKNISKQSLQEVLDRKKITLLGAGMDEAPMAYKNIHQVMGAQKELVHVVGVFQPKVVKMADAERRRRRKR